MGRLLLLVVIVLGVLAVAGIFVLGAFPPSPHTEQVQRVLPNDRFQPQH